MVGYSGIWLTVVSVLVLNISGTGFVNDKPSVGQSSSDRLYENIRTQIATKKFYQSGILLNSAEKQFPSDARFKELRKSWVIEDYKYSTLKSHSSDISKMYEVRPITTGCQPGKLSAEAFKTFTRMINYYRRLAGITDSVTINAELSRKAQSAALMMASNNQLNHAPPSKWKCFSKEGALAASKGNLSLGYGFTEALLGQITDDGAGNQACGHRRWILNPLNRVFGVGSNDDAMCLYVIDTDPSKQFQVRDSFEIAWPGGYFPQPILPARWSFSMSGADFSKAKVSVSLSGKPLAIKREPLFVGYAMNTLVWQLSASVEAGKEYTVLIENILIGNGYGVKKTAVNRSYKVIPIGLN